MLINFKEQKKDVWLLFDVLVDTHQTFLKKKRWRDASSTEETEEMITTRENITCSSVFGKNF